jgi:8-oxo-dGTP pyrophosphatase MutT (NUDIX family)
MRVPIREPESVPVTGIDDHLPGVAPDRLEADAVRERFRAPPRWRPEFEGDGSGFTPERPPTRASVLVPLVRRGNGLQVLLTLRTAHLRDHAGQVSFPGGRQEPDDADTIATALREAEEEVGLARRHVEVVGTLPVYMTVTGFRVTPVVGLVEPDFSLALDAFEVVEAFEVPLAFLMQPRNHRRHRFEFEGGAREFLSMPWEAPGADGHLRRYFIWGATAAMLRNLYRLLAA